MSPKNTSFCLLDSVQLTYSERFSSVGGISQNTWSHSSKETIQESSCQAFFSLVALIVVLTHILFCYIFQFLFHFQVHVIGPLLLNAGLLLVLTTDYSDWLVQVDVVGPLLLNAGLLLVLTTDYSDWLVQVTELDN